MTELSHIDADGRPAMVDVGHKPVTLRSAVAESRVRFPPQVAQELRAAGFATGKGPVFHTAIVAGVMAAKRTHELIPFCHPLGLERCDVTIEMPKATRPSCAARSRSTTGPASRWRHSPAPRSPR